MNAFEYLTADKELMAEIFDDFCMIERDRLNYQKPLHNVIRRIFSDESCYFMLYNDKMDRLKDIEVIFDGDESGLLSWKGLRHPYYRLRGKSISPGQAAELIRRTENDELSLAVIRDAAHSDGTVGCNSSSRCTYPVFEDLFADILVLKMELPYLDFVIAVSGWNESPSYEKYLQYEGSDIPCEYPDFCENIDIGVWVHDNKAEFLGSKKAAKKFAEYDNACSVGDCSKYIL